ncbi:MAG TPA: NACHT domain-containing protein, partial [Pyrinomonadaceae bacterium]|nr:NACHT domain-containing protein [Pyrinomonadaceae bacterium]
TLLDEAWASDNRNVVSLVAWGGVGKSTLVNKWLERMAADNYRGARRVYAWSFYSQGTGERVTSADQFINAALLWFGDTDPTAGSPWDKGERLARFVQSEKTLLLLDGLEPLQSPHAHERGKIKDPALLTLLTELARNNPGLCLITTRERVSDLAEFETATTEQKAATVLHKDLEQISDEAGRALLRVGGVQGTDAELEQATRAFGNHALAVNLLAVYLRDMPNHHIAHAAAIPDLDITEAAGKHPRRLMAAFAAAFGDGPEVELLKMLGLFDRPADKASLRALRRAPAISGLTDHIRKLTEAGWLRLLDKLRRTKLIAPQSQHRPDDLDAHPLVREHFGQELKQH